MKPLTVSPIGAADPDLAIAAALFDRYRQFYGQPSDPGRALDFLHARLRASESVVLLARMAGSAAGLAQLYPGFSSIGCCPTMVLNDLYVDPGFEGQGVGQALVTAAKAQARQRGAASLWLETAVDNLRAQRLYERLGFTRSSGFHTYACPLPAAAGDVT